jgi:hypothetical protein
MTLWGWWARFVAAGLALVLVIPPPARSADGYWLDQYNVFLFLASLRLDRELAEIRRAGSTVVMVHADILPDRMLSWISWRSRLAGLEPIAWIQRPNPARLKRVAAVRGFSALQVDDHFFADPPMPVIELKKELGGKQLWCSFQPRQYSWHAAQHCDHVDIQVYRQSCQATVDIARELGVAGWRDTAIAVYHDGSPAAERQLNCMQDRFAAIGNRVFVFKWRNPEHWLSPITRPFWLCLGRLRVALGR